MSAEYFSANYKTWDIHKILLMLWACRSLLGIMQGFFIQQDNRWPWPNTFQKANIVIFIWFIMTKVRLLGFCLVSLRTYHIVNNPTFSWYSVNLYQNTLLYQRFFSKNSLWFYVFSWQTGQYLHAQGHQT